MSSHDKISRGAVLGLIAMGLSVIVLANDFTAMNVALPTIERDLDSDITTIQWVINAYALVFGMLIVTGGRLADVFGRRRVFFIGATIFAALSVVGGLAESDYWLIGARGLMGIGGALMWPAILGMTFAILPKEKAALAGGLILGAAGIGQGSGPIVGGLLTDTLGWRWVQFINLPIAAVAMLVTWRTVPRAVPDKKDQRVDYAGIITLSIGLFALLFALDQVTSWGWSDPRIIGSMALAVILVGAFIPLERRAGPNALVPSDIMASSQFTAACVSIGLVAATFFAVLLYVPQFMQKLLGWSALEAGLGMLPGMVPFAILSFISGRLYDRFGAKTMVSVGAACLAIGPLLLSLIQPGAGYRELVPGLIVFGIGMGVFFPSVTTAAVTELDPDRSSLAGGIVYMFQIVGGSIGLGLTTMVFASGSRERLASEIGSLGVTVTRIQQEAIQGILAGTESAHQALAQFEPAVTERLISLVRDAFVAGFGAGLRLDALLALVAFVIAVLLVGGRLRRHRVKRSEST